MADYETTIDLMKLLIKIKYFSMQMLKILDGRNYHKQLKDEALDVMENHCRLMQAIDVCKYDLENAICLVVEEADPNDEIGNVEMQYYDDGLIFLFRGVYDIDYDYICQSLNADYGFTDSGCYGYDGLETVFKISYD